MSRNIKHTVEQLRALGPAPSTAIVLGSGLGPLIQELREPSVHDYESLGIPSPSVAGHAGELHLGQLGQGAVALLSGRIHPYEGRDASEVVHAVRSMAGWGVQRVILTCSVGAIHPELKPGDLLLVEDHINFTGCNPLIGDGAGEGERFIDLSQAYHPQLRADALQVASDQGWSLRSGVLASMRGPSYETPAEIRMLAHLQADIVGMSTVPEIIALAQLGVPAMAVALVTNFAAGISETPLHHEEVLEVARDAGARMRGLLTGLVECWS